MRKITLSFITAIILLCSFTANAVLNMGGKTIFTGTLIEILEPGSATQIQDIIDNITDASATKPYLIHLGPGVYDLGSTNIVMKEWVSIQGSGQESTKVTGAVSTGSINATSAILVGENNAGLTDLTIENIGGSGVSIAIFNNSASPRIERVSATASGGTIVNHGVSNSSTSSPIMSHVSADASGGANNTGIYNTTSSSPTMKNVAATGSSGVSGSTNDGVRNINSSSPIMDKVTASGSGSGGTDNYGVFNSSSSPVMTNVTANGSGGVNSYGVIINSGEPFISDSILEGSTKGLFLNLFLATNNSRIVNSKIIGGVQDDATGTQCRGNYDGNLDPVGC